MIDDDGRKRSPDLSAQIQVGQDLSALSEAELQERIETLKGEIARTERTLRQKEDVRVNAEALFGPKS